ncbi:nucleotidyltransferase family protein [Sphingomonas sp. 2R-10]|uniref:nucleotidyltransferase family protein n=1 Tax=Sphingomonas sp. 2R-10 TaxID=3045148 RepID=UPI000F7B49E7|nr:nucleotidyltransferase family protein [Sphingomonas sp. 2R-10]MDJ0276946.1 nucleotidyltransferase family protein [Sphingomonas sp. 2R-10]
MEDAAEVIAILRADPLRWRLLGHVRELGLPDGWIGAGFVRNAVWDRLHGRTPSALAGDVDVIWYDPHRIDAALDREHEAALRSAAPGIAWSVRNQARMHVRNGDAPYASTVDAMRFWPETATAVAVRRVRGDDAEVAAPFGLHDLLHLILRPIPPCTAARRRIHEERAQSKGWRRRWPLLREVPTR